MRVIAKYFQVDQLEHYGVIKPKAAKAADSDDEDWNGQDDDEEDYENEEDWPGFESEPDLPEPDIELDEHGNPQTT